MNADLFGDLPTSAYQQRVTGTCTAGTAVSEIAADGNVTCINPAVPVPLTLTQPDTDGRRSQRLDHERGLGRAR